MSVSFRQKKDKGIYYTPESTPLITFLCQQSILSYIYDMINKTTQFDFELLDKPIFDPIDILPDAHLEQIFDILHDIRILDPSVGSGVFLINALSILEQIYQVLQNRGICDLPLSEIRSHIVINSLFGVDTSKHAVEKTIARLCDSIIVESGAGQQNSFQTHIRKHIRQGNALLGLLDGQTSNSIKGIEWFDWELEFPDALRGGGFHITLGNPPWNILKPLEKEFFSSYDPELTKYRVDKITARKKIKKLLSDRIVRQEWLNYKSNIRNQLRFFRSEVYNHQSGRLTVVGNKKTISGDFNLYKLFLERTYELTLPGGYCGVIIPSGFHTDAGTKGLRELIFDQGQVKHLHCFENRNGIFPNIHRSFKFDILIFKKAGNTKVFHSSFMNHNSELVPDLPGRSLPLDWNRIKDYSPSSWSIMEFKSPLDLEITEHLYKYPPLGQDIGGSWKFRLKRELDITLDSHLFNKHGDGFRVFEGKMIEQYNPFFREPRFWITDDAISSKFGVKYREPGEIRLAFRAVAASTNRRTMIATILPVDAVCGNSLILTKIFADGHDSKRLLSPNDIYYLTGIFNSFVFDFLLRLKISQNLNMFFIYDMPVPRISNSRSLYKNIVSSVNALMRDPPRNFFPTITCSRLELLAQVDCLVAQLYGLDLPQFDHILDQFHLRDKKKEQLQSKHKMLARQLYQDIRTS
ncbi:MAG: Eco57I restriction-modification methylase domain-containing protein [Candidatus Heimdallarchaeota archaeon]